MRIRHSVTSFFAASIVPAVCVAVTCYFGWSALDGPRGLKAYGAARAQLQQRSGELASIRAKRERLEHRILLLEPGSVDPDMVEEVVRSQLMEGPPGEVAVPRGGY